MRPDAVIRHASAQILASGCTAPATAIRSFFDPATSTVSHVAYDPDTGQAAIIDPVLDYDAAAGRISTRSAEAVAEFIEAAGLTVCWILETHVHADHLSGAAWLRERLGGTIGIGQEITAVQRGFRAWLGDGAADGNHFDRFFADGDHFLLGRIAAMVLHLPGHTPACVGYLIGNVLFVGDTLFMPDYGTARTDFPGGDARQLYRSIQRLFQLPPQTRLYLCHDYLTDQRSDHRWETSIAAEMSENVHVRRGVTEEAFVAMRSRRDTTLSMPQLIWPSVQVNMRAGELPALASNGQRYLKIPLNVL